MYLVAAGVFGGADDAGFVVRLNVITMLKTIKIQAY